MIDVKTAVATALGVMKEYYEGSSKISDILLEEVELSDDGRYWLITLGFSVLESRPDTLNFLERQKSVRKYKIFQINAETNKVLSMKIRTV